ncbi:hypothetical protein JYU34_007288 [Plutella xylostella]|uniref:MADF domain-containing protein n=1 Tax=Plutella xylostella TaxID=51655 RepID=A0ABQ7QQ08_PLUXY|nr:hypothetical protein JYU34_007288 [Plutella xylostella]
MDSDSRESFTTKEEPESDNESPSTPRTYPKKNWDSESTFRLIEIMKTECKELWDVKHPLNKDRVSRTSKQEYLARTFETSCEEISRKIHNLRSQFNNELRKIKRRRVALGDGVEECGGGGGSSWEYFEALSFLLPPPSADPLDIDGVNLALAEFQANEEVEFSAAARAASKIPPLTPGGPGRKTSTSTPRQAAAPPPVPAHAHPMLWPEESSPRIRPLSTISNDECQIFGDFVASELRTLRSDESRKQLKRLIQKAILHVGELEDVNMIPAQRL